MSKESRSLLRRARKAADLLASVPLRTCMETHKRVTERPCAHGYQWCCPYYDPRSNRMRL